MGRADKKEHCGVRVVVALRDGKEFENPLCSQLNSVTLSYVALFQKWGAVWGGAEILCPETQPGTLLTQDLNFSVLQN